MGTLNFIKTVINSSSSSEPESSSDDEFVLTLAIKNTRKRHTKVLNYIISVVPRYDDQDFRAHFRLTRSVVEVGKSFKLSYKLISE